MEIIDLLCTWPPEIFRGQIFQTFATNDSGILLAGMVENSISDIANTNKMTDVVTVMNGSAMVQLCRTIANINQAEWPLF